MTSIVTCTYIHVNVNIYANIINMSLYQNLSMPE